MSRVLCLISILLSLVASNNVTIKKRNNKDILRIVNGKPATLGQFNYHAVRKVLAEPEVKAKAQDAVEKVVNERIEKVVKKAAKEEAAILSKNKKDLQQVQDAMKRISKKAIEEAVQISQDPTVLAASEEAIKQVVQDKAVNATETALNQMLKDAGFEEAEQVSVIRTATEQTMNSDDTKMDLRKAIDKMLKDIFHKE